MIDPRALRPLALDAAAVRSLLPHRPPLLLVDGVEAIASAPPALRAFKLIELSEPVLAGHFPERPIWPGVYTIEGLAQTCALACVLLRNERVPQEASRPEAVLAAADVKLTAPVLAGVRLDYLVVWTHSVDTVHRFEVEATVRGKLAARGTLTLAVAAE